MRHEYTLTRLSGRATWYFYYYDDHGKRHRRSTGTSVKHEAHDETRKFVSQPSRKQPTLREYCKPFFKLETDPRVRRKLDEQKTVGLEHLKNSRSWLDTYVLEDPIADMKFAQIRRRDVLEFRSRLVAELGERRNTENKVMAATTGMRRGEILALKWGNVNLTGAWIRVAEAYKKIEKTDGTPKSGKSRDTPIPTALVDALTRLQEARERHHPTDYVFCHEATGAHMGETWWRDRFRAGMKKAKIDWSGRNITPHSLGTPSALPGHAPRSRGLQPPQDARGPGLVRGGDPGERHPRGGGDR